MITINKNSANECVFTLNEKTTLTGATYLLEIFSNQNHSSKVIALTGDSSVDIIRYNRFTITEVYPGSEILSAATVNLEPGTFDYFAYQTTGDTLSLTADTTTIVESGKLVVIGSATTTSTFTNQQTEYTFE
jgi:hypothetical protein